MPGPLYGFSKPERKRVKKQTNRGASLGSARVSVMKNRPAPRLSGMASGFRNQAQNELASIRRARRTLEKMGVGVPTGLTAEQAKVLTTIVTTGKKVGATPKEILSAVETGLVEASLTNPTGGDGTSAGWRQEIDTYGSVAERTNVPAAAARYFSETAAAGRGRGVTAGQLAQSVQRSAFPDRYDERRPEAKSLLNSLKNRSPKARSARSDIREAKSNLRDMGLRPPKPKGVRPLAGPYSGSRAMVRMLLGAPVKGDKEPGHAAGGMHDPSNPNAYAQDIGSAGASASENEPAYSQQTVTRVVRKLRKMGADIPKGFKLGQNYEGVVRGYQIQFLTAPHGTGPHIHLGAQWGTSPGSSGVSGGESGGTVSGKALSPQQLAQSRLKALQQLRRKRRNRTDYGELPSVDLKDLAGPGGPPLL